MAAAINKLEAAVSIYTLRPLAQQRLILLIAASISVLTPVTDTIILPALISVGSLVGSTPDTNAAIISAYMGAVGIFNLFWGPLSDRFGRRGPLLLSLALYLAITVGCIFAPTASGLLGLRAAQGAVTGATISVTQGVVADVFAPHERGTAMGFYFLPLLVGPIVAPVVGGLVTAALDWRAVFMFCAALGLPVLACALALPETHQWMALRARERAAGVAPPQPELTIVPPAVAVPDSPTPTESQPLEGFADPASLAIAPPVATPVASRTLAPVIEEAAGEVPRPSMRPPWEPLHFLIEPDLAPYYAVGAAAFGGLFVSFTVFPGLLASPPYSFPPAAVGAAYLPIGVALMVGSIVGGHVSDAAGLRRPGAPTARLLPSLLGACALPAGALLYGWAAWGATSEGRPAPGGSLAGVIIGHVLIGIGQGSYGPGFFAYLSASKQSVAAAAGAAALALNFSVAAVSISAAVPIQEALGLGGLFSIIAGVNVAAIAWAALDFVGRWRRDIRGAVTEEAELREPMSTDSPAMPLEVAVVVEGGGSPPSSAGGTGSASNSLIPAEGDGEAAIVPTIGD